MSANTHKPLLWNSSKGYNQTASSYGKYGVLGQLLSADGNITTDQAIVMPSNWILRRVIVINCSTSFATYTTADGNIYTATGGGGTALLAAGTITTNMQLLTAAAIYKDLTLATLNAQTAATVYWRMATAFGGAGTFDVYLEGLDLS